jgi:hypothetical protein
MCCFDAAHSSDGASALQTMQSYHLQVPGLYAAHVRSCPAAHGRYVGMVAAYQSAFSTLLGWIMEALPLGWLPWQWLDDIFEPIGQDPDEFVTPAALGFSARGTLTAATAAATT